MPEREDLMSITLEEFKRKLQSGEISLGSSLKMRNEQSQVRHQAKRYNRIERKKSKLSKLLIPKEIALDFDPRVGYETEEFNQNNKFRPIAAATTLALAIKAMAAATPETKERIMKRSGMTAWDLSDLEHLTPEDKIAFRPYLYPQIFTLPTFNVKLRGFSKNPWGRDFIIRVDRDPITAKVVGDVPTPLQANYLYSALAREEVAELEEKVKSGEIVLTDEQITEKKRNIYSGRVKVSSDRASNYIRCVEIPLDAASFAPEDPKVLATSTQNSVQSMMVLSRYTAELESAIAKFRDGAWKRSDNNFDYYELDMVCPNNKTDPKEIGQFTRYEKVDTPLSNLEGYDTFMKAYYDFINDETDVEQVVWTSTGVRNFMQDDEVKMLTAMESDLDLKSPYFTQKVITANKDIISKVFGEIGDELILAAEAGFSEKPVGNADNDTAAKEAKEYDLSDLVDDTNMDLDIIE